MSRMSELHADLALRDEMERDAAPELLAEARNLIKALEDAFEAGQPITGPVSQCAARLGAVIARVEGRT